MKLYFQLAWRNLWRNKRRTLIATTSVLFAVILSLITRSMQHGYYDYMIDSAVRLYTGYIQIHSKGYWENRSLDESMVLSESMIQKIRSFPKITTVTPRLETYSLISFQNATKITPVFGIDPVLEDSIIDLKKKIVKGEYLSINSEGMLIAEGLAKLLKVDVGDSVVIYGQGYHGVTAAAQIPIQGIVKFILPALNNATVYLSLPYAQWLYSAPERITSLSIMINNIGELEDTKEFLAMHFSDKYEVMDWAELMPELVQGIEMDNASGIIMLFILYVVIGFGIFGTVMTMTAERIKEFGILVSVGMKKGKLILVAILETMFVSFIGAISGILVSIPLLYYFHVNPIYLTGETAEAILAFGFEPILPFSVKPGIFFAQVSVVFLIAMLSAIYPITVIRKLEPVKAMRK
ncbi:MAG: FtsX-like permease family protein [Bacteroidetes bacterium]|nr:FtsX-like permease family protein [Bacteroidota bacterium]